MKRAKFGDYTVSTDDVIYAKYQSETETLLAFRNGAMITIDGEDAPKALAAFNKDVPPEIKESPRQNDQ